MKKNENNKFLSVGIRYGYDYSMVAYCNTYGDYKKTKNISVISRDDSQKIPTCICVKKWCKDDSEDDEMKIFFGNQAKNSFHGEIFYGITPTYENVYSTNTGNKTNESELFPREEVTTIFIKYLIDLVKNQTYKQIGKLCLAVSYDFYLNKQNQLLDCCFKAGIKRENVEIINYLQSTLITYDLKYERKNGLLHKGETIVFVEFNEYSFDCYCCRIIGDDINDILNYIEVVERFHDETI